MMLFFEGEGDYHSSQLNDTQCSWIFIFWFVLHFFVQTIAIHGGFSICIDLIIDVVQNQADMNISFQVEQNI